MNKPFVVVLMGSDSDFPTVEPALTILQSFGITAEVKITSAHRTPADTHNYVTQAEQRGCAVFICAAGMAAHLAGTVAAITTKPVIGIPINASLDGLDALLATVQMPAGIPVATVAIGKAGAKNAAYLAAQILGVQDASIAEQLRQERAQQAQTVRDKNQALQAQLKNTPATS